MSCDNGSPLFFSTSLSSSSENIWERDGVKALNWILVSASRHTFFVSFYFIKPGRNKKFILGKWSFPLFMRELLKSIGILIIVYNEYNTSKSVDWKLEGNKYCSFPMQLVMLIKILIN